MRLATRLLLAAAIGACGSVDNETDDAAIDAADVDTPDAAVDAPDAAVDVDAPPPPPQRAHELTAAGGRLSGGTYTFEVQLGHGLEQRPSQAANHRLEPNTAIKP